MQTCVCRNLYTGTHTVPDSYSCLCECSLIAAMVYFFKLMQLKGPERKKQTSTCGMA